VDAQKESGKVPHAGCYLLDFRTWRMCHAMDIVRKLIHGILCNERGAQFKLIDIKILPLYCIRLMLKSFSPVLWILAVPLLRVLLSLYSCSSSSFQGFKTRLLQKSTKSFDQEKHRIQIHERTR